MRRHLLAALMISWLSLGLGCAKHDSTATNGNGNGHRRVVRIEPGPEAQKAALEALINAQSGDVIEFAAGTYEFDTTLALELEDNLSDIMIKGAGMDQTILNFAKMEGGTGGEGIKVAGAMPSREELEAAEKAGAPLPEPADPNKRDNIEIADLTVQDSKSDGIKVEGARGVIFRRVKAEWTRGPHEDNGAYGVYPVLCTDVLVEESQSIAASDAGIYVGQSENVIVRGCTARQNVAGIEIENTVGADVHGNKAEGNTGGILVFTLPGLPKKVGRQCRVFNNEIVENNHENFAKPGNIVATVPPGAGLLVMANDQVEVFNNKFKGNNSFNVAVISFVTTGRTVEDPEFDPYCEGIAIHDNEFEGGGEKPAGEFGTLVATVLPAPIPDIIYDGVVDAAKAQDGQLPRELGVWINNNKGADFASLGLAEYVSKGGLPVVTTDEAPFTGELPALPQIVIEGVD